jgi:hypothetical protein
VRSHIGLTLVEALCALVVIGALAFVFLWALPHWGGRTGHPIPPIHKIDLALERYYMELRTLPPDTGFSPGPSHADLDPGSLWRYLCEPVYDPRAERWFGPYLEWPPEKLRAYDDALRGESYQLLDHWGNPYGYAGDAESVVHNRGKWDVFSIGPDGVTASNDGVDNDGDGEADEPDERRMNGAVGDDISNWQEE